MCCQLSLLIFSWNFECENREPTSSSLGEDECNRLEAAVHTHHVQYRGIPTGLAGLCFTQVYSRQSDEDGGGDVLKIYERTSLPRGLSIWRNDSRCSRSIGSLGASLNSTGTTLWSSRVKGEFVWHRHDETDDFFLVLKLTSF